MTPIHKICTTTQFVFEIHNIDKFPNNLWCTIKCEILSFRDF
jgi:hypothetical protein